MASVLPQVHGNELSGSGGEIASPMFPHTYFTGGRPDTAEVSWRVTVDAPYVVSIRFDVFEVESSVYVSNECLSFIVVSFSTLKIRPS